MSLKEYQKKRKFKKTSEPKDIPHFRSEGKGPLNFVVQKHTASHLHYDFRLEMDGVLKSWAVPKGISMDPEQKHLAVMVEDHPLEYLNFKGEIPKGQYGAGKVEIWDKGNYATPTGVDRKENEKILLEGLKKGHLTFILNGKKLKGEFALVRLKRSKEKNAWLLIRAHDKFSK